MLRSGMIFFFTIMSVCASGAGNGRCIEQTADLAPLGSDDAGCRPSKARKMLGQVFTAKTGERVRILTGSGYWRKKAGHGSGTADLRTDRINIWVDCNEKIVSLQCG
jgi:hypothetical protein